MPVGAGSIKRAAKLNAGAAEAVKESTDKKVVEEGTAKPAAKTTARKSAAKNTTAAPKAEGKETAKKTAAGKPAAKKTAATPPIAQPPVGNQVYHLTEELPVYLL